MSVRSALVDSALGPVLAHFDRHGPGGVVGLYLCASAASAASEHLVARIRSAAV